MKTRKFNLQNWSGEEVTVSYNKKGEFKFYDYEFRVEWKEFENVEGVTWKEGEGCLKLFGDDWNEGKEPMTTLFLFPEDGETDARNVPTLERQVIAAVRWVAYNV